jgi:hypothetical protein
MQGSMGGVHGKGSETGAGGTGRGTLIEEDFVDGVRDVVISVLLQQVEGWVEATRVLLPGRLPASRPTSARSRAWLCRSGLALLLRILRGAASVEHGALVYRHARRVVECLLPVFGPDVAIGRVPISLPLHMDVAQVLGVALPLASSSLGGIHGQGAMRASSGRLLGDAYGPARICQWTSEWLQETSVHQHLRTNELEGKRGESLELASTADGSGCAGSHESGETASVDAVREVSDYSSQRNARIIRDSLQRSVHAVSVLSHFKPTRIHRAEIGQGDGQDECVFRAHKCVVDRLIHEVLRGPEPRDHGAGFVGWLGCLAVCVWPQLGESVTSPSLSPSILTGHGDMEPSSLLVEEVEWLNVLQTLHSEAGTAAGVNEFSMRVVHEAISGSDKTSQFMKDLLIRLLHEATDDNFLCFAAFVHVCILLRLYDLLEALFSDASELGAQVETLLHSCSESRSASKHEQKVKIVGLAAVYLSLRTLNDQNSNISGYGNASIALHATACTGLFSSPSSQMAAFKAADGFVSSLDSVGIGITMQARIFFPHHEVSEYDTHFQSSITVQSSKSGQEARDQVLGSPAQRCTNETRQRRTDGTLMCNFFLFVPISLKGWGLMLSTQKSANANQCIERKEPLRDVWFPLRCFVEQVKLYC